MTEKLIITLSEHLLWGHVLQPVLVRQELTGAMSILEIVSSKSTFFPTLTASEKEIVLLADKVSDKSLMKSYSKENNIVDFHKKVAPETIERYIRPAIENYHRKVITVLKHAEVELYLRVNSKTRVFYDIDKIKVQDILSTVVFNFQKDKASGLRYFISLRCEDDAFELFSKSYYPLCNEPAILVIDHKLHIFSDIDIKKLTPFFTKNFIEVPEKSEKTYIEKFVKTCVEKYEVNSNGLEIVEIQTQNKAVLTMDVDFFMKPVLNLNFKYNEKLFPVDSPNKKYVYSEITNGIVKLNWFLPNKNWEQSLVNLLLKNGLVKSGVNSFSVDTNSEEIEGDNTASLVEWLQLHADVLSKFEFLQQKLEKKYFIGEISVDTDISAKQDWFDIQAIAVFGEFRIPFSKFRFNILNNIREFVLPDKTIAILPSEWFTRYYELMFFSKKTDAKIRLKKYHFEIVNKLQNNNQYQLADNKQDIDVETIPQEINAELRNYQQKGYTWLLNLYKNNFGGCLADDMGLGKTLQTITLLQKICNINRQLKNDNCTNIVVEKNKANSQLQLFDDITPNTSFLPSLIVMPTSLIHNWHNEFRKFAPGLKIYIYSGSKRLKSKDIFAVFRMYDVVLTTYGTLRNDIDILENCEFHHFILDESQYVKNADSITYKSVKRINSLYKLALTGTPVENSLNDLWAQLNIVNEGLLGSQSSFKNAYINPINKNNKAKEEALLTIIKPFVFRRTKDEVAPELPALSQETVFCDMSDDQQTAYVEEKNKLRSSLLFQNKNNEQQKIAFLTLQGLTRLRLLANHPRLFDEDYTGESGKFEQIIMRFQTLKSENHKVLIFSSFVKHLRLLSDYFDKESWKYSWLSGSTPPASRESEIEKFKTDPNVNCFFISLKAGGVGLNLTAADYVFIIDPWWNPAAEMQALSRSHRIGQDKKVMVYRFISTDSIEEKIKNLQEGKSKLAQTFITSSNPLQDLNKEDIYNLIE